MTGPRAVVLAIGLAVAAAAGPACTDSPGPCICTEEYRLFTVTVLDDAGRAVPDAAITRTNLRTGEVLEPLWLGMLVPGSYVVAEDGFLSRFSEDGDPLRVVGQSSAGDFDVTYTFATPGPCRCHVVRLAGPDTVVIGEPPP